MVEAALGWDGRVVGRYSAMRCVATAMAAKAGASWEHNACNADAKQKRE
jgi:hypothetical protein